MTDTDTRNSSRLVAALRHALEAASGASVEWIETHAAWVLLSGDLAYKIKKPVDFGFLDYSSLDKRRFFCEEEIRLNRRLAPEIYLDVATICGDLARPQIDTGEPVLEYAVRMRRFPAGGLLSQLAADGRLQVSTIDQLVERITGFHQTVARATQDSPFGQPERIHHWVRENFDHIRPALSDSTELERLEQVRAWTEAERQRIDHLLQQRKRDGFIRECHGDLHLGNITLVDGQVIPFDCIEFNPELRWIDVFSEVAFLLMDLDDRGLRNFAFRFLNAYLQSLGDYPGLGVLRYYLVYRSMVRAKVAVLRGQQAEAGSELFSAARAEYRQYMDLALRSIEPDRPRLVITWGLSGSGKSTLAGELAERLGFIQVRSDIERKRLAGLGVLDTSESGLAEGLYSAQRSEETYARLAAVCEQVLKAGYPVIADATFLRRDSRDPLRKLAAALDVPFVVLACSAPVKVLEARITGRRAAGADPSEATLEVLHTQLHYQQPPRAGEAQRLIEIDTSVPGYLESAQAQLETTV